MQKATVSLRSTKRGMSGTKKGLPFVPFPPQVLARNDSTNFSSYQTRYDGPKTAVCFQLPRMLYEIIVQSKKANC